MSRTLRLNMPQWQGGNMPEYHLSSRMLSWLLPHYDGPQVTIPVPEPKPGEVLPIEDGIRAKAQVLAQAKAAMVALDKHQPDRVLTIGGDCLVDFAPIAWLNKKHGGSLGVLWIDAHPDIQSKTETANAHAQVLALLLGEGDQDFVDAVDTPLQPSKIMYAGLDEWSVTEGEFIRRLGLKVVSSDEIARSSSAVTDWIASKKIKHLAVHLDIDVLLPQSFRAMLFNKPDEGPNFLAGVPRGSMEPQHVIRLLQDVGKACEIVGLAITEYMSWEALQTQALLKQLPLVGD